MSRLRKIIFLAIGVLVLLSFTAASGCAPGRNFSRQLSQATRPYLFSIAAWEFDTLTGELGNVFKGDGENGKVSTAEVEEYFDNIAKIASLTAEISIMQDIGGEAWLPAVTEMRGLKQANRDANDDVEAFLEGQIRDTLVDLGIAGAGEFHPVNFELASLPKLLVVSPRDRIESIREITLLPEMTREEMEALEAQVDELEVSSLVVPLGGLATYPSLVSDRGDLSFVLKAATEEWLHLYLAFKPLGFRYLLDITGLRPDYDIATMNETVAGIVSREISDIIYAEHYATGKIDEDVSPDGADSFDFNGEMREIRRAVDVYLAEGKVEEAETYMEERRRYLRENGYYIRKLNQAYFAFYGTYADRPASVSPIGAELRELRDRSQSLKEFLTTVEVMTSRQDLAAAVAQ